MSTVVNPVPRGQIAQVPDDLDVSTGAAKNSAVDIIAFVQNKYQDLLSQNEAIYSDLISLIKNFELPDASVTLAKVGVDPVTYPSAKAWGNLVLNSSWPKDLPLKPSLEDFGDINFEYIEPLPPGEFNASFSFVGKEYSSELRTALAAAIYNEIVNGGYGLPPNVHAALIDKERNARLRNQAAQTKEALQVTGESGFVLGMGSPAQKGVIAEVAKAQAYADQDSLNAITEIDFNTYQRNKEFFHSLAVELEKIRSGEWDSSEQRRFEAGRIEFELALRAVEVNLEVYLKKWDSIKIKSEALKTRIEAIASANKSKTDQYIAEYDAYRAQVEAVGAENTSKVQIRGIEVDTWAKEVEAVARQDNSFLQRAEFDLKQLLAEIDTELRVHGINTEGYKAEGDLKAAILEALSKITAQVTASTIGAMNASASMGFSGSESVSRSLSDSASVSESYSASLTEGT